MPIVGKHDIVYKTGSTQDIAMPLAENWALPKALLFVVICILQYIHRIIWADWYIMLVVICILQYIHRIIWADWYIMLVVICILQYIHRLCGVIATLCLGKWLQSKAGNINCIYYVLVDVHSCATVWSVWRWLCHWVVMPAGTRLLDCWKMPNCSFRYFHLSNSKTYVVIFCTVLLHHSLLFL